MIQDEIKHFESTRQISSSLAVAALIAPRSIWAPEVLKDLDAINYACKIFSQNLGKDLAKNFNKRKLIPNFGFDSKTKVTCLPTDTGQYCLKLEQQGVELIVTWFKELKSWSFTHSNGTVHDVFNIVSLIK